MIIKKIGVIIFSLIFVTTLSMVHVKADEIVSTYIDTYSPSLTEEENKQINGAKYLIEYLRQGGSIDLTNKSNGYTAIDLLDDVADFFNGTIASIFGDDGYWINNISNTQVPEYIYLKEPIVTSFINFGLNALCDLSTIFPTPSVPEEYASYIQLINGTNNNGLDFFWRDYQYIPNSPLGITPITQTDYSFVLSLLKYKGRDIENTNYNIVMSAFDTNYHILYSTPITIYITEEPNTNWLITAQINTDIAENFTPNNAYFYQARAYNGTISNSDAYMTSRNTYNNSYKVTSISYEFSTLTEVLTYCVQSFRNVNIYVNGVPWSLPHETQTYSIDFGQGTYVTDTNTPIQYDYPEPTKIDLTDLINRLDLLIANQNKIKFPDFSDLIVDENGQQAVAVVVVNQDLSVDDWYVTNYGTLIPLFPVYVTFPVEMSDITTIATVGIKDVIPTDILEIFGIALIGMLFVTWIHRLLE